MSRIAWLHAPPPDRYGLEFKPLNEENSCQNQPPPRPSNVASSCPIASQSAWEIVRSLVVGYIDEEEPEPKPEPPEPDQGRGGAEEKGADGAPLPKEKNRAFRLAGKAVMNARLAARTGSTFGEVSEGEVPRLLDLVDDSRGPVT